MAKQPREAHTVQHVSFAPLTFKEGGTHIAYVPELDLSSCGPTTQAALRNLRDAVEGFLETSADMGALDEILGHAGLRSSHDRQKEDSRA